ncbi:hypothetical protein ACFIOY_23855 [Bradyrhizobium sp. TZ2]
MLVLRERQIAYDEISVVCAGRRRKAGREHLAILPGTGREAETHGRDKADVAELLLLDIRLGVRAPLEQESKMARADPAVDSAERPKMSGCSFPENAVSGVFGLMSSASVTVGRDASSMASIETRARRNMNYLQTKNEPKRKRAGLRQTLNCDVNIVRRFRGPPGPLLTL